MQRDVPVAPCLPLMIVMIPLSRSASAQVSATASPILMPVDARRQMTAWQDAAASGEPSVPAAWASASISSCV